MEASIVKLIISQGIFAVLFVYLLFYVLKENSKRETNYQEIVNNLSSSLPNIEDKLDDISKQINKTQ